MSSREQMERIWENEREQARSSLSQALASLVYEADVLLASDERAKAFRKEMEKMLLATPSPNVLLSMDKVISFCERMEDYANLRLEAGYVLGLEKGMRFLMMLQSGGLAKFLLEKGIL